MTERIFCDTCGKELGPPADPLWFQLMLSFVSEGPSPNHIEYDCCTGCTPTTVADILAKGKLTDTVAR